MFNNILGATARNLKRNWLHSAISILGLGVSFVVVILISIFVSHELSFDQWISNHRQIYKIFSTVEPPGQPPIPSDLTQSTIKAQLELELAGNGIVARHMQDFPVIRPRGAIPEDAVVDRGFAWVDPAFFDIFEPPVIAGDLKLALRNPAAVVMTRRAATRYLGSSWQLGQPLEIRVGDDYHSLELAAVLADFPSNTSLTTEIFASGMATYSGLSGADERKLRRIRDVSTYVRLNDDASYSRLTNALNSAVEPETAAFTIQGNGVKFSTHAVALAALHMADPGLTDMVIKPTGSLDTTYTIAAGAALIVLIAAVNFVSLMTARASTRMSEVSVRKVNGASQGNLIAHFLGETVAYATIAMMIASITAAFLISPFGAFVHRELGLELFFDPLFVASLIATPVAVGVIGGLYPAYVLARIRPAVTLKGSAFQGSSHSIIRQTLVFLQFAILLSLIAATITVYRQTQFALKQGLGAQGDLIVQIYTGCDNAFPAEVRKLNGVTSVGCSSLNALNAPSARVSLPVQTTGSGITAIDAAAVDFGFFETFGVKPLSGRLFSEDFGTDGVLRDLQPASQPTVMLNQAAVLSLGFTDPDDAVGEPMYWRVPRGPNTKPNPEASTIVGVIADLPASIGASARPMFYYVDPVRVGMMSVKLGAQDPSKVVDEIRHLWKSTGAVTPIQLTFFSETRRIQYLDFVIQSTLITFGAIAAVAMACSGLFAVAVFVTRARRKEIGVRKVMGANTGQIVRLLLWQFSIPILLAALVALPIAYALLSGWLQTFAYRVELPLWTFVAASSVAIVAAWMTVILQVRGVASQNPAIALRDD